MKRLGAHPTARTWMISGLGRALALLGRCPSKSVPLRAAEVFGRGCRPWRAESIDALGGLAPGVSGTTGVGCGARAG